MQLVVVQNTDNCTYFLCAHMCPKHLQFAQINKKFQSDVNNKLIVQRSELVVLEKNYNLRIEPKQFRKTAIHGKWGTTSISFFENVFTYTGQLGRSGRPYDALD